MGTLEALISNQEIINWALNSNSAATEGPCEFIDGNYNYQILAPGILMIEPERHSTGSILISCGIHGNETAPIELVEQLFSEIVTGTIKLNSRLLLIFGNLNSMARNVRFCDENLNRLFKNPVPDHDNIETQRAREIMPFVDSFFMSESSNIKIHLDLHTAIRGSMHEKFAIYPFQASNSWHQEAMAWLSNAGIEAILLSNKPSGTFSCYTDSQHEALGFTVELGKARAFGENDHSRIIEFKLALVQLLNQPKLFFNNDYQNASTVFKVVHEVLRHTENEFTLNLADDFLNFTTLNNGYELTTDGIESYRITDSEHAVVFPNKHVPVGQRVALVVEPYQLE